MIDHATEIVAEASDAMHKIRILSQMLRAGLGANNSATVVAEIISLARDNDQPLADLAKEMVALSRI